MDWFDKRGLRDTSNPYWPLPADYADLAPMQQQAERLKVLRDQSTPEKFVTAWSFFRRVYLGQTKNAIFYKRGCQESPDFHASMVYDLGAHGRNANAAPRGFAKCGWGLSRIPLRNGQLVFLQDIQIGDEVIALDSKGREHWSPVIAKEHSGKKKCLRVRTKQGHNFICTPEHRILANNTWIKAGDLKKGNLIATPRTSLKTDATGLLTPLDAELLGILIGDGSTIQSCLLTNFDEEIIEVVRRAVGKHPHWELKQRDASRGLWSIIGGRHRDEGPCEWLREHGLFGCNFNTKRISPAVWAAPDESLAAFLRGLFDTDGTVNPKTSSISLTLANEKLIRDVQLALLRLGVRSRYTYHQSSYNGKKFDAWGLSISSQEARQEFARKIGFRVKAKQAKLEATLPCGGHDATDFIHLSREERKRLRPSMWYLRKWYGLRVDNYYNITRPKLLKLGCLLNDQELMDRATSDIYWDPVISIEAVGEKDTYDIQVEGNANFLCEGVFVHNSTVITIECVLLLLLTKPGFDITVGLATDKLVEKIFARIRRQIEHNELILQDFGVMRPKRGDALWSHHQMSLNNGSELMGLSVMGKKRGGRPALFILDDPENDPDSDSESSRQAVIDKFEMILFKQIIPMLESGSSCFWIGTLIDRKSFLFRALRGDDDRFNFWNRKIYKARSEDEDGTRHLLWEAKWPWDVLEARKEEIGPSAFASEYMNEPISAKERLLSIDERKNEYEVEGVFDWGNPLTNNNKIIWDERLLEHGDAGNSFYVEKEGKFHELVLPMFRFILFDYARSLERSADYSCIAVCGMDTSMCLWVLDLWMGREKKDTLLRLIYEKGLAWQVRVVGIEAAGVQTDFVDAYQVYAEEQNQARNDNWIGRVFPIRYPARESKADRIASLEWRFNSGRIKLPRHMANTWPWDQLYAQISDFTMDLGLLPHDDAVDTISMSKHVVKSKGSKFRKEKGTPTLAQRIIRENPIQNGIPLLSGVSSAEVSDEMMNLMSQKARGKSRILGRRKRERPRGRGRRK